MPRFMLLPHRPAERPAELSLNPADYTRISREYREWADRVRAQGHLKGGNKLMDDAGKILKDQKQPRRPDRRAVCRRARRSSPASSSSSPATTRKRAASPKTARILSSAATSRCGRCSTPSARRSRGDRSKAPRQDRRRGWRSPPATRRWIACAYAQGAAAGLAQLEALNENARLAGYAPYHAACGELLLRVRRPAEAAAGLRAALGCPLNGAERDYLTRKLSACAGARDARLD